MWLTLRDGGHLESKMRRKGATKEARRKTEDEEQISKTEGFLGAQDQTTNKTQAHSDKPQIQVPRP